MTMKGKVEIDKKKKNRGILKVLILCFFALGVIFFLRTSQLLDGGQASSPGGKAKHGESHVETRDHEASGGASHSEDGKPVKPEKEKAILDKTVRLSPEVVRMSGIKTEPVRYRRLVKEIQTVGEIAYDERRVKVVSAWIGGRIDKLLVDFTGVEVKEGDPLAELYSPELVSTQQEYLLALETMGKMWSLGNEDAKRSAKNLLEATRQRLLLWGISEEQIDRIERTRKVNTHMTIHAPIGGTVIHKRLHEGQYVKTGEPLYRIADLSVVWALSDIYEYEMAWVKRGQKVSIITVTYPGVPFTGTVSFIDPFLDRKTRTVKVRMDVPNPKLMLKPGMFVETRLKIPLHAHKPVLSIPHTAVLDTGIRKLVYVEKDKGEYVPVEVRVGPRAGNYVAVLSGLRKGQRVASSANYLIDSQSTLGGGGSGGFGGSLHGGH
jgi:Cu(I)/Ag(I) efflux system membrane fusion protein